MLEQQPTKQPLVSFITVNYNQSLVTLDCLESIYNSGYSNFEIIVVDNASTNDDPKVIGEKYPEVNLILSNQNLGFAGGNNLGLLQSKGEYIYFINNDTEVVPNSIEVLVERLQSDSNIGVVSPKIRFHHTPDTIQFAGYTPMNYLTMRNNLIGYRQVDSGQYDLAHQTPFCHGAAMMLPRTVIKEVGMMADIFFLYYEEHDWFERIRKAGFTLWYEPKSLIYHKESISTGKESPTKIHYIARNRIVFLRRNVKGIKKTFGVLYQMFIAVPKNALVFLLKGRIDLFKAYHKAMAWNLKNIFNKAIFTNPKIDF
jgi:GT2 family glycosyltransferase